MNQATTNDVNNSIQSEKYIGIPYVVNGRDSSGIDCYGLVRLVYKEELGIELPSFVEDDINPERTQDLIAQYKEGWEPTENISAGDVVIFRIMGVDAHIAIAISPTHFLHARQGYESAIESFSSSKWKTRLVGSYKYSPVASVVLNGIPHPLRTERITTAIPPGTNIVQLEDWIIKEYSIQPELKPMVRVLVNGIPIPDNMKECTVLQDNDCVEYRVVAQGGGDPFRTLLTIAVIIAAPHIAASLGTVGGFAMGTAGALTTAGTIVSLGLTAVGMSLVNAIAPVRLPSSNFGDPTNPGSAERQLMITGGANRASQYGSIPFVLGKVRITPPLGANSYSLFNADGTESYLRMLLVWGYGPVYVDESTLKIGELPIGNYTEVNQTTLNRITEPTAPQLAAFNALYGTDVTQVQSNVELTCDGTAGITSSYTTRLSTSTSLPIFTTTFTLPAGYVAGSLVAYQVKTYGRDVGSTSDNLSYSISGGIATFTGILWPDVPITVQYSYDQPSAGVTPGPWLNSVSTDGSCDYFTIAVHFPQGCRKVSSKGDTAGQSFISPVNLEIEYKSASSVTWTSAGVTIVGNSPAKDAFTKTIQIYTGSNENVQVRIRRLTGTGNGVGVPADENYQWLFTSTLLNVTYSRNVSPAEDPVNCKIAKTALQIRASKQFNSQIEGVNAIVWTYGKSWNGTAWVDGTINNPAALFRHVLEHPANPRRVTDAATKIDLVQLQHWHEYCTVKGFTYNAVVGSQRAVLDILRDICAAGRASPSMVDGKWTVTIDEPKSNVVQHFSPHNSWGFEGAKALPRIPDGLRVNFINEAENYQESETIVYATASSESTAALLESISVPGVTTLAQAQDHARWHMAQAKLRPETYTLNTDIEYIVCNRGDRVKVMHDVPMWGLGSGRIKGTDAPSNRYYLDEDMPMKAGVTYTIRVRGKTGISTVRTVVAKVADGYYNDITLTASATAAEIDNDDMFLFGELNQESQDCIVLAIEPMSNKSARLTLVDYGVTSVANIYTDYLNYTNTLAFESQISLPPTLLIQSFGTKIPTFTSIVSDEKVMQRLAAGVFAYKMQVAYTNAIGLPATVSTVEFQWDFAGATDEYGIRSTQVEYNSGSVLISGVEEGEVLKVRARYVGNDGRTGLWTDWTIHVVIGKTNPPSTVTGFAVSADNLSGKLKFAWNANSEPDIKGYEVRTDTLWGNPVNLIFEGDANTCQATPGSLDATITYYIKAIDYSNNYSLLDASVGYTVARPVTYSGVKTYSYADTSTTDSTVTFKWDSAPVGVFAIEKYEITLTRPLGSTTVQDITGTTWTTPANWVGTATFSIKSKDILGNTSSTGSTLSVVKNRPAAPSTIVTGNFKVVDSQLYLDWTDVLKVANGLPVDGYEVRLNDINWGVNDANFVSRGSVSNSVLKTVVPGLNTWYVNTFDTDGVYATNGTIAQFTAIKPNIATTLDSKFEVASATSGTVTFLWVTPAQTSFPIAKYRVKLTKPDTTVVTDVVDALTWTIPASWSGTAVFSIVTIDVIGNESNSTELSLIKNLPNDVGTVSKTIKPRSIYFDWPDTAKTTLPVVGYEIRADNSGWGNSSYIFKGSVSAAEMIALTEGINTWYIKAYDTSGLYSNLARTITHTITKPSACTIPAPTFANTSNTGTTITFSWAGVKNTFDIDRYLVSLTRGASILSAVVYGNTWTIPVDWTGDATFKISAVDTFDLVGTEASYVVSKATPAASISYTATPNQTGLTLKWTAAVQGSLPVAGYELRTVGSTPGGADFIWKGTASSVEIKTLVLGSNSWDLWTYDTDNRYSATALNLSYTVNRPSDPSSLSGVFSSSLTNNTVSFTWVKPSTSAFGIARYDVSIVSTNPVRTITNSRNTTDWVVSADWLGDITFAVTAVDYMGISSNTVSTIVSKVVPLQPAAISMITPTGTAVELDWPDTAKTTLPIAGYELRTLDTGWGGGGYAWRGNVSSAIIDIKGSTVGSTLTWYLKAYDTDNKYSTLARSVSYQVLAPTNTASLTYRFEDTNLTSATVILNWLDTSPIFGLKQYEVTGTISLLSTTTAGSTTVTVGSTKGLKVGDKVTVGTTIPINKVISTIISATQFTLDSSSGVTTGTSISTSYTNYRYTNATTITLPADWLGDKSFTVKTVDLLGNFSTGISVSTLKLLPASAANFRAQIIDNNVLLYWALPNITTLPISHARIKKGSTWNSAELIGDKSGTFTNITELQGGTYTYWIAVVDTDNNESAPISLASTVSSPPDYIFNAEWTSDFNSVTSVFSNAIKEVNSGFVVLPVDTVESFAGHFTSRGWVGPEDPVGTAGQIDQGYPVYIQPGLTTGYYEEVFDYGTLLGGSQISVALYGVNISGTPTVSITISTSADNILYDKVYTNTSSAFGSAFRYVKVRVSATQATSGNIYSIQNLVVRLDAKQKTDSKTVAMALGGAQPQGNISHDYIDLWIPGSLPTTQYQLNGLASENSITLQAGPGGYFEPIWNCIDSDVAVAADGGWNSTYTTVDTTKGHLIAMFINRSTIDGITYFGTNTNSTVSTLAGVVNANPYFLGAIDLPAVNTWYLVVGYVHEIGYGTTDTNISGIYNLSGTRLVAGTEFKFNSGTGIMHRVYHYDNPTNSGLIVQKMARPVVLQCTTANAPSVISYLLQCATGYGMSVTPAQSFIDIISITATPQGSTPSTPLVDFNDIPNPKRFNIFNYNSSGTLVSGNVSWIARGY